MELDETVWFHLMNICAYMILETSFSVAATTTAASLVIQLGKLQRWTGILVINGIDLDLTLRLVWFSCHGDRGFDPANHESASSGTEG